LDILGLLTNRLQISLGSSGTRHLTICTFPLKQLSNMLFFPWSLFHNAKL
jgi:hypothetical protein